MTCTSCIEIQSNGKNQKDTFLERFDPQSEFFLTPEGKKRHPLAFAPFFGGKRICLGKTFAETVSKVVVPTLLGTFDFEFVDGSVKPDISLV